MSREISSCSSTSTTDLHQRQIISSDSCSQTITTDHDDEDYANYDDISLQKPPIMIHEHNIKKSDQTTLCRINRSSIACWTRPAYLHTN
jgi:hypothetical protein